MEQSEHFTWIDYPANYKDQIETWCDESVIRFALDGDSVITEHQWYLDSGKYEHNENYFCKIVLDGDTPVALLMLAVFNDETKKYLSESIVCIDTLIINPALRNKNYGTKIIADAIQNAEQISGSSKNIFISQIHKDNIAAKKLSAKLGFHFICIEAEKNHNWFDWVYPVSAADRYLSYRNNNEYLLVMPNASFESEYCRVMDKWETYNEKIQPPSMRRYGERDEFSYSKWLTDCEDDRTTGSMLANNIPCTLYYFVNQANEILGGVDINHANTFRGQIHVGIVPWHRDKGYGTIMLKLAISLCKEMGMISIQVAPRKDNIGANKIIKHVGGELLEEFYDNDIACLRYIIKTT